MADKRPKWTRFRSRFSRFVSRDRSQPIALAPQLSPDDSSPSLDGEPNRTNLPNRASPSSVAPTDAKGTANAEETSSTTALSFDAVEEGNIATLFREREELPSVIVADIGTHSDVWSKAYQEALKNMGNDIDVAILAGENAERMFVELGKLFKQAGENSAALRGIAKLKRIKPPLEKLKFVVEVASPLGAIHPVASTALGVVKSVVTIAVSIAAADVEFAKQIAEMLEQMQYINDCDTFGQKTDEKNIHHALVLVYQKLLEFYQAAYNIVKKKGFALVLKMMLEAERLPQIVEEFIQQTDSLRKLIGKATAEIVEDIRNMVYDQQISNWLGWEKMKSQVAYQAELKSITAPEACKYLETDTQVIRWYTNDNCQSLAIIGDTGFGKSVSMSFLIDFLTQRNAGQVVSPKLCYYFCRDGSTGNSISILCGLIFSLLLQFEGLKKSFVKWYKKAQQDYGTPDPTADAERLMAFLEVTVQSLDRPLLLLIDGLDECDRKSRNTLVEFLTNLACRNKQLKYLLSSRPQEEILDLLGETDLIQLGPNLERDRAIVSRLVSLRLPYISENVKHMIREKLAPLAQGSGIWTKMIVTTIEVSGIRAESRMSELLKELPLPSELSKLYKEMFERYTSNNEENKALALLALNFLAAARRDLSIKELTCAVTLGIAPKSAATVSDVERFMDCQRVMDMIQPFISQVDFQDLTKRQVRLVHQSVKEFVVANSQCAELGNGIGAEQAAMDIVGQRIERLERSVLDLCVRYLLLDDIAAQPLFSTTQAAVIELPQEADLFTEEEGPNKYTVNCSWDMWEEGTNRYDPTERGFGDFFVYASSFWIEHLAHVSQKPLPAVADIERLCHAKSLRLQNWTQQSCRPGCAIQARYEFDSELYDPLSITSLYGSEAILYHLLENADFSNGHYLPDSPISAAEQILQWGDLSRLVILFAHDGFKSELHTLNFFRLLIRQWSLIEARHSNWDEAFDLINQTFGAMTAGQWGNELLCISANTGCIAILQRLMKEAEHNPEMKAELWRAPCRGASSIYMQSSHQSVGEAILMNRIEVVRYLLEQDGVEAHLEHVNMRGQTVLHIATDSSNPAMVELLQNYLKRDKRSLVQDGNTASLRVQPEFEAAGGEAISSTTLKEKATPSDKRATTKQETLSSEYERCLKTRGTW